MIEIYEIHPLPDGKRCVLTGPLGAVERLELDSIREAALHAQACAQGNEALLRLVPPGRHIEEREGDSTEATRHDKLFDSSPVVLTKEYSAGEV
jgi:hypothetical protein